MVGYMDNGKLNLTKLVNMCLPLSTNQFPYEIVYYQGCKLNMYFMIHCKQCEYITCLPAPDVIKLFTSSTKLGMEFILLINDNMSKLFAFCHL